jgi:predicted dehydrogenase
MERCEVAGVKGRFVLDDMWQEVTLYPADSLVKQVYTNPVFGADRCRDFGDTFRCRLETFVRQVAEGVSPERIDGSGADGLAAQEVLQAAIDSLERRAIIDL